MDISLFLAQAFGLFLLIGGAGMLLHPHATQELMRNLSTDRIAVFFGGFITLLIGAPLIVLHNIWDGTWEVLVTVLVWITFLKGVMRILVPDVIVGWSTLIVRRPNVLRGALALTTIIGAYLCYVGFLM